MDPELEEKIKKLDDRLKNIEEALDSISHQIILAFGIIPVIITLIILIIIK